MKSGLRSAVVMATVIFPVVSNAQSALTRAQVRSELVELSSVGYGPSGGQGDHTNYPAAIQAAEAKLAARNGATAFGGVASSSYETGGVVPQGDWRSMYSR